MRHLKWLFLACLVPFAALAEDRFGESRDQDQAYRARTKGEAPALNSVIGSGRRKGRVLDAQLNDGKYKLKILDEQGRVRSIEMEPSGGYEGHGGGSGNSGSDRGSGSGSSGSGRDGGGEGSGGRGRSHGR
jgi:hypothetical protein